MHSTLLRVAAVAAMSLPVSAQSLFATSVVDFQQGGGGGIFVTDNILGGPQGAGLANGSLHVLTLGENGVVTLGFDVTVVNGPGADLTVFENGFAFGGSDVFAELAWVEVSTNGVDFARFPTSHGPGGGSSAAMGANAGVSGGLPVIANVLDDVESPFDPAFSGGEALDLDELTDHPLVLNGLVDLQDIHFVRLVDLAPDALDDQGVLFGTGTSGGSDFDAVAILNHVDALATLPICDLEIDDAGFLIWTLGHPDGFFRLNPSSLSISVNLQPFSFMQLFKFLNVQSFDGSVAVLRSFAPLEGQGMVGVLGVSIEDDDGTRRGDQAMVQDI